ncbi:hypothetical protein ACWEN6_00475 [Sphaerisporangium sp. NPDC004334]
MRSTTALMVSASNGLNKYATVTSAGTSKDAASAHVTDNAPGRRRPYLAMFAVAIAHSSGDDSTPIAVPKPCSAASMSARPFPAPKSTRARPSAANPACRRISAKSSGSVPSCAVARPGGSIEVSVPCRRSNSTSCRASRAVRATPRPRRAAANERAIIHA